MIPKIDFRYSRIYDSGYKNSPHIIKILKKKRREYPSQEKIKTYISQIERLWEIKGDKILKEIQKITKLKWKERKIVCYVIGYGLPISDPLTLRLEQNKNDFLDTLSHELIHQIQIQDKRVIKWFKQMQKEYEGGSPLTKNHIFLHAVHWKILEKLFGKKRLNRNINKHYKFQDYNQSWKIVEKEGADKIIKDFHKALRKK